MSVPSSSVIADCPEVANSQMMTIKMTMLMSMSMPMTM